MKAVDNEKLLHKGHRERMREKFRIFGRDVFNTHELLEMLLYYAIPHKNTNPLAIKLINTFGSLDGVLSKSPEELMAVKGVGPKIANMLSDIGSFFLSEYESEKTQENTFDDFTKLGKFFVDYFSQSSDKYTTAVMLLNSKMELLTVRNLYSIDFSSGGIKPQPFVDAALEAGASVAVISHNHPYGPAFPTGGDLETNKLIASTLAGIGVLLLEHYVVSGSKYTGFMTKINLPFSEPYEIEKFLKSKETAE